MAQEHDPSGGEQLVPALESYCRQFAAIEMEARRLLEGLTEAQQTWHHDVRTWSIVDCLNHLVVTGNHSLRGIRSAVLEARANGLLARGPFRHGVLGNCFIRLMDAPPRIKFRVPNAYRPLAESSASEAVAGFFRLQRELLGALHEADGIDLARVNVANPVSKWFKMSLGQEFAFTAAHERRHLWQASRVRAQLSSRVAV